jgi:hypothetical protein
MELLSFRTHIKEVKLYFYILQSFRHILHSTAYENSGATFFILFPPCSLHTVQSFPYQMTLDPSCDYGLIGPVVKGLRPALGLTGQITSGTVTLFCILNVFQSGYSNMYS